MSNKTTVAFALGGLAGNNAHGAGFLQAALDRDFKPQIISCTSGQIRWVAHYLEHLNNQSPGRLRTILQGEINGMRCLPWDCRDADFMRLWCLGVEGVYEPAFTDYALDWMYNLTNSLLNIGSDLARSWHNSMASLGNTRNPSTVHEHLFITRRIWEIWPCRLLKPSTSDKTVKTITKQLTAVADHLGIGIVFNSYDPAQGREHVYLNKHARACVRTGSINNKHYEPKHVSTYRNKPHQETIYHDIDADAVHAALHLYAYGFEPGRARQTAQLDGAYFRDIILSELASADHIFVARPMPPRWQGELPETEVAMQDMQTEVMFKSSYIGEKSQIELVNKLLGDKRLTRSKYHHVELHEIEMAEPRGFFDYCFEDLSVFDYAHARGKEELNKILPPNGSHGLPVSRGATRHPATPVPANGR